MKHWIAKLFSLIVLLGYSCISWASIQGPGDVIVPDISTKGDLSIAYLGQLFGHVGTVLHGASGQMLGHLFLQFNEAIVIVACVWMGYTTVTMLIRSASQGMQQQHGRFAMVVVRLVVGIAFLVPLPAASGGGYDSFQTLVMEVVVQGVKLADVTWDWGLSYLQEGGMVYIPASEGEQTVNGNAPGTTTGMLADGWIVAMQAMQDQTCMDQSQLVDGNPSDVYAMQTNIGADSNNPAFSDSFPGAIGSGKTASLLVGGCGHIQWQFISQYCTQYFSQASTSVSLGAESILCHAEQSALDAVVADVGPAARDLACQYSADAGKGACSGITASNVDTDIADGTSSAMIDFQNLMRPVERYYNESKSITLSNWITGAKSQGWIMAGRYYWDLSLMDRYASSAGLNGYGTSSDAFDFTLTSAPPTSSAFTADKFDFSNMQVAAEHIKRNTAKLPASQLLAVATDLDSFENTQAGSEGGGRFYQNTQAAENSDITDHALSLGASVATFILTPFTGGLVVSIGNLLADFNQIGMSPIAFLHKIGMDCLSLVSSFWLNAGLAIFGIYTGAFTCSSTQGVGFAARGLVNWLKPMIFTVMIMLGAVGVMLAYYVPLYPYLLFTFGCVSWLILVVESMAAAPLVALGLTHPEGHDFMGKSEQSLMLLLGVFLRPVLMVIGMIAAMILSYVVLNMVVFGFGGIIKSITYGGAVLSTGGVYHGTGLLTSSSVSPGDGAGFATLGALAGAKTIGDLLLSIIVPVMVLMLFAMVVKSIVNQCFSLIYVLPTSVLRWIGAPMQQDQTAQAAREVMGGAGQGARQTGQSGAQGVESSERKHAEVMGAKQGGTDQARQLDNTSDDVAP